MKDKRGQLPLHRAAAIGSVPLVKLLIEEGKSPLNATDVDGLTALHHAISEGHGEAALTLLRAGAEADKRDSNGQLAIELSPDSKVRDFQLCSCNISKCKCRYLSIFYRSGSTYLKLLNERASNCHDDDCIIVENIKK